MIATFPELFTYRKDSPGDGFVAASIDDIRSGRHSLYVREAEGAGRANYRRATTTDVELAVHALEAKASGFVPSPYQAAIFDFVENGSGDGFVDAVAGSGKTTTLVQAAKRIRARSLFCAFNRSIVGELKERLPQGMDVSTISGLGKRIVDAAIGRTEVDDYKYNALAKAFLADQAIEDENGEIAGAVVELVRYIQSSLTHPMDLAALKALMEHHDMEVAADHLPVVLRAAAVVLRQGIVVAREQKIISYGDMLWLPHVMSNKELLIGGGLRPRRSYYLLFVEDLSPAQLAIVMKHRAPGGRILFVGDPRQAIYGFAGADNESVNKIVRATNARRLPLSVCYRCPQSHIQLAKAIVPHLEAAPNAPVGILETITESKLPSMVKAGDLVLCRNTSPLVALCFKLIELGVSARVRGREIGKTLQKLLKKVARLAEERGGASLPAAMDMYQQGACAALAELKDGEARVEALVDQMNSLRSVYTNARPQSLDEFLAAIEGLFDDGRPSVILSTVHRAKGLEEDTVFILHPERMPSPAAKQPWQLTQEENLRYVAYTRAKKALYLVPEDKK